MKKLICMSTVLLSCVAMYSCTPKAAKTTTPVVNTNEAYQTYVSNYNEQALATGKTLYEANCGKCHKHKDETKFTIEKWDRILDRMIPKAKLSEADGKLVRAYVYTLKLNEK